MTSRMVKNMAALRNIWCVFLYCLVAVDALFFHISETETRCFIEEVPDETLIVGKLLFLLNQLV